MFTCEGLQMVQLSFSLFIILPSLRGDFWKQDQGMSKQFEVLFLFQSKI